MSYILDALKKSDQERKQGDVPGLQTIHIPINTERQTPWVLYGVIGFLLLVLAFVIGLVMANKEPDRNQQQALVVDDVVTALPVVKQEENIIEAQKTPASNEKVTNDFVEPKPRLPVKPLQVARAEPVMAKKSAPAAVKSQPVKPDFNDVPYLHELPDYQQQSVPQMTFAGHVYSSDSSSRSVIINDVFMSEGDTVLQGISIIEITPTGVVFSLHDDFFRMDILQDWSFE